MGNMLSATFGYGISVPNGEESDFEFDTSPGSFLGAFVDDYGGDINWYDALDVLGRKLNLAYDTTYLHDYSGDTALFAEPVVTGHGLVTEVATEEFEKVIDVPEIQVRALENAAATLGIPFKPRWILAVSYG